MAGIPGSSGHNMSMHLSKQAMAALIRNTSSKQLSEQPSGGKHQMQPSLVQNSQFAKRSDQPQHNVEYLQLSKAAHKAMSSSRGGFTADFAVILIVVLIGVVVMTMVMEVRRRAAVHQQQSGRASPLPTDEQMKDPGVAAKMMRSQHWQQPEASSSTGTKMMRSQLPEASSSTGGPPKSESTLDRAFQMLMARGADMSQVARLQDPGATFKPSTSMTGLDKSANMMSMTTTSEVPPATRLMDPEASPLEASLMGTRNVSGDPTPRSSLLQSLAGSSQSAFVQKVPPTSGMPPPIGDCFVLSSGELTFNAPLEKFTQMALGGNAVSLMGLSGYPLFHVILAGGSAEDSRLELALSRDVQAPRAVIKPLAPGSLQQKPSVLIGTEGQLYGQIRAVGSQIFSVHHEDKEVMVIKLGVNPDLATACQPSALGGATLATAKVQTSTGEASRLSFDVYGGADPILVTICMLGTLYSSFDWSAL